MLRAGGPESEAYLLNLSGDETKDLRPAEVEEVAEAAEEEDAPLHEKTGSAPGIRRRGHVSIRPAVNPPGIVPFQSARQHSGKR